MNKRALRGRHANSHLEAIVELVPPSQLIIPLINYNKQSLTPQVAIDDEIKRGQVLANGIIAPASGTVKAIELHSIIHPEALKVECVVISNDGLDTPLTGSLLHPDTLVSTLDLSKASTTAAASATTVQEAITQFITHPERVLERAALTGLGGAGFPTWTKLNAAKQGLQTLIINAAECEPEIACDEALMQTSADEITYGIEAMVKLTQCTECIVAIEDSKPLAIERMRQALEQVNTNTRLLIIPTRYPTGAESPLIQTVTGKFIPHNEKPIAHGVLCINVATAHALWLAINGQALDSRIVSLGGAALPNPCNVRVRFGTPIRYVLEHTDNLQCVSTSRIRAGGPLSGFDLHSLDAPVTAKTNCIAAEFIVNKPEAQPCIRCGDCADVCPAHLLPQQLHWYAVAQEHEKCEQLNLDACIECGCCDLVCPASIKLTETFRYAKSASHHLKAQQQKALAAAQRFEDRERRLQQREQAKQEAIERRKEHLKTQRSPQAGQIGAALARAQAKRSGRSDE